MTTTKTTHLIVGHLGEVGSAIYRLLSDSDRNKVYGIDLKKSDVLNIGIFDFVHICFPDTSTKRVEPTVIPEFVEEVAFYFDYAHDKTIFIIHSTVFPGTTSVLSSMNDRMVYSPVRGRHEEGLESELQTYMKFFMTTNKEIIPEVRKVFNSMHMFSRGIHGDPITLEFAKLLNTTWFFNQVIFTQEVVHLSKKWGLSVATIKEFIDSTGDRKLLPYAQAVGDKDHDHCCVPNAHFLAQTESDLAEFILNYNKKFKKKYGDEKYVIER